jgi:hypothetical protein
VSVDVEEADKTVDDKLITKRRHVTEYLDNTREEREWAELHRDYFDDKQWTAAEIATLQARGQPVITDNKIKDKVEYMEGVERKSRTDPKAFPRTPVHDEDADVVTDALRFIFDENRFSMTKSAVYNNMLIEGWGAVEVIVDKANPKKVLIRRIRWDRLYRDPYSMEPDCSDASYIGVITWMDEAKAKEKWPGKHQAIETTSAQMQAQNTGESTDDKPRWVDAKRKRIQVFEEYEKKKGSIYRSVFCWGGFLEEEAECPYVDDDKEAPKHEWPIIPASAYVDREGRRYGLVKRYISKQDAINKRQSKSLHLLNSKTVITETGAVENAAEARKEVHKPDGWIEVSPGMRFDIEDNLNLSAAHLQMLQQDINDLSVTGPNAALLGQSGSISGRAKELDQMGGALQIGVLPDNLRDFQLRVAKATWHRVCQYWDEETVIRVTDSEMGLKFIKLNEKTTQGELAARRLKGKPPEEIQAALEQIAQDPQAQQPAIANNVAELEVDIIIDETPDNVTLQSEDFEKMVQLAGTGMVQMPPEVLIEASGLSAGKKKRIMEILKPKEDPVAQMQAQFSEFMMKMEGLLKQAEVRETNASAALKEAQAGKTEVDAIATTAKAMSPDRESSPAPSRSAA